MGMGVELRHISPYDRSKIGLAQRWFVERRAIRDFDRLDFTEKARQLFELDPGFLMMILESKDSIMSRSEYVSEKGGGVVAVVESNGFLGQRRLSFYVKGEEPPREKYWMNIPFHFSGRPMGLDGFLAAAERFEEAQRLFMEANQNNPLVVIDWPAGEIPHEQSLLRIGTGKTPEEARRISQKTLYTTEPYVIYRLLRRMHEAGELTGARKAVELGCGLGMVAFVLSIFVPEVDGIEMNPYFARTLREVVADPLHSCGKVNICETDLENADLSKYDLLFLYSFWTKERKKLFSGKVEREIKPGTLVIERMPYNEKGSLFTTWKWWGHRAELLSRTHHKDDNLRLYRVIV